MKLSIALLILSITVYAVDGGVQSSPIPIATNNTPQATPPAGVRSSPTPIATNNTPQLTPPAGTGVTIPGGTTKVASGATDVAPTRKTRIHRNKDGKIMGGRQGGRRRNGRRRGNRNRNRNLNKEGRNPNMPRDPRRVDA